MTGTDPKTLRSFGLLMAGVLAPLLGLVLPWLFGYGWPVWPWVASAAFGALALAWPAGLGPVYRGWMGFAHVVGWVNTRLLLGLVFFLVITPIGLLMRLAGRDPMRRRFDPSATTYRIPRTRAPEPAEMERPF